MHFLAIVNLDVVNWVSFFSDVSFDVVNPASFSLIDVKLGCC